MIPVTSTKRFLVLGVTVVIAALMIGGKETVCLFESKIIGTLVELPRIEPYSFPKSVLVIISEIESVFSECNGAVSYTHLTLPTKA